MEFHVHRRIVWWARTVSISIHRFPPRSFPLTTPESFYSFYGKANASNYTSAKHSLPPTITNSHLVRSSRFNNNSSRRRYFYFRRNCSVTFNYMVYMFSTCKGYFSIILGAICRESFRLTGMHKLSPKDADLHVLLYVFLFVPGLHLK